MDIHELASLVKDMRDTQKSYFTKRDPVVLQQSKKREQYVDHVVKQILIPDLFDPIKEDQTKLQAILDRAGEGSSEEYRKSSTFRKVVDGLVVGVRTEELLLHLSQSIDKQQKIMEVCLAHSPSTIHTLINKL